MDNRPTPPLALDGLDPVLRDKYLTRTCTPDEQRAIDRWLAVDSSRQAALAKLDHGLREPMAYPAFKPAHELASAVNAVVAPQGTEAVAHSTRSTTASAAAFRLGARRHSSLPRWWRVPAAASGIAVIAAFGWMLRTNAFDRPSVDMTGHRYATASGQRSTITLSDGSTVTLAPNTTLTLAKHFGPETRQLALSGEAYFNVAHAAGAPFVVQTGRVHTRVTGTVFDVRHYPRDPSVKVVVVTGKVVVGASSRRSAPLTAGTIGHVTDSTAVVVGSDDVNAELSWTRGSLAFRDIPLGEVVLQLNHWYGIDLRVEDTAMAHRLVTGTFAGESCAEALSTLQTVLHLGMTFDSVPGRSPILTLVRRATKPLIQTPRDAQHLFQNSSGVGR